MDTTSSASADLIDMEGLSLIFEKITPDFAHECHIIINFADIEVVYTFSFSRLRQFYGGVPETLTVSSAVRTAADKDVCGPPEMWRRD